MWKGLAAFVPITWKQEQTLFKMSAAGFDKVFIVWQSFYCRQKAKKLKKNILKVIF